MRLKHKKEKEKGSSKRKMMEELDILEERYMSKLNKLKQWKETKEQKIWDHYHEESITRDRLSDKEITDSYSSHENEESEESEEEEEEEDTSSAPTFYTCGKDQFRVNGGATACTVISMIAVYILLGNKLAPSEIDWERAIEFGAKRWKKEMKSRMEQGRSYRGILDVNEVYNSGPMKRVRNRIKLQREYGGTLNDTESEKINASVHASDKDREENTVKSFLSFQESICDMVRSLGEGAAIFTARTSSIAMHFKRRKSASGRKKMEIERSRYAVDAEEYLSDEYSGLSTDKEELEDVQAEFWLFNSHGGIKKGRNALIHFPTKETLIEYIKEEFPPRSDWNDWVPKDEGCYNQDSFCIVSFTKR